MLELEQIPGVGKATKEARGKAERQVEAKDGYDKLESALLGGGVETQAITSLRDNMAPEKRNSA